MCPLRHDSAMVISEFTGLGIFQQTLILHNYVPALGIQRHITILKLCRGKGEEVHQSNKESQDLRCCKGECSKGRSGHFYQGSWRGFAVDGLGAGSKRGVHWTDAGGEGADIAGLMAEEPNIPQGL